jgi:hypothetical protein
MGLKGYRLWAMGKLDSTCRAPPRLLALEVRLRLGLALFTALLLCVKTRFN